MHIYIDEVTCILIKVSADRYFEHSSCSVSVSTFNIKISL